MSKTPRLPRACAFKARAGGPFHFALPVKWVDEDRVDTGGRANRAFWEASTDQLPYFLRAASLEASAKWQQLSDLAVTWTRAEPLNAGSWRALRIAQSHMQTARVETSSGSETMTLSLR